MSETKTIEYFEIPARKEILEEEDQEVIVDYNELIDVRFSIADDGSVVYSVELK